MDKNNLTEEDLKFLRPGRKVTDSDGDLWVKNDDELWDLPGAGRMFAGWASETLLNAEGPIMLYVDEDEPVAAKVEKSGVWVVWVSSRNSSDGLTAIFPQDQEIEALRRVNEQGYGKVEFVPFGEEI